MKEEGPATVDYASINDPITSDSPVEVKNSALRLRLSGSIAQPVSCVIRRVITLFCWLCVFVAGIPLLQFVTSSVGAA